MKTLNINTIVRVKLTPAGIRALEEYHITDKSYERAHEKLKRRGVPEEDYKYYEFPEGFTEKWREHMPKADEEGFCEMSLLEVMWYFGSYSFATEPEIPFDFEIQIDEKELK